MTNYLKSFDPAIEKEMMKLNFEIYQIEKVLYTPLYFNVNWDKTEDQNLERLFILRGFLTKEYQETNNKNCVWPTIKKIMIAKYKKEKRFEKLKQHYMEKSPKECEWFLDSLR